MVPAIGAELFEKRRKLFANRPAFLVFTVQYPKDVFLETGLSLFAKLVFLFDQLLP